MKKETLKSKNARAKQASLKKIARAKREFANLEIKTRELARNTVSAVDFLAETVRAESRHFAAQAVTKLTTRLTTFKGENPTAQRAPHDVSLEPLAGVNIHVRAPKVRRAKEPQV